MYEALGRAALFCGGMVAGMLAAVGVGFAIGVWWRGSAR